MSSLPPPSPVVAPGPEPALSPEAPTSAAVDLDRIAQELADVEVALERLDEGTYWTCEVTGEPLPDELLAADPVARRHSSAAGTATPTSVLAESAVPSPVSPDGTTAAWPDGTTATW